MYAVASKIWGITRWIWTVIIIAILISLAINVLSGKPEDISRFTFIQVGKWILEPGVYSRLTLAACAIFIVVSISSWFITLLLKPSQEKSAHTLSQDIQPVINQLQAISNQLQTITRYLRDDLEAKKGPETKEPGKDSTALMRYLYFVEESTSNVGLGKIAPYSQTLIPANVPLDDIFVHMQAIPDRPVYDTSHEQQGLLDAIRQSAELSIEGREVYIQRLRTIWQSQLGQGWGSVRQSVPIEEVLRQLRPENNTAVILGSPGSGKSTFLRWLALHMAQAFRSSNNILPDGLSPRQIPILICIRDYAESLEKDNFNVKQFLSLWLSEIHPGLPGRFLDELATGHCLVIFDGLDEVTSYELCRRVTEAISTFIAEYSSSPKALQLPTYNRFVITSRIVGYEPGTFAKWTHYTLINLEDQQIGQFLASCCSAIEIYKLMSLQGMQSLTEEEKAEAVIAGAHQRDYLLNMLKNNPEMKYLATNPLMLTIMTLLQLSGTNTIYERIHLYQTVIQTFLGMSNGQSMILSDKEFRLAERMLTNLAHRLQGSVPVLTEYNVEAIARQTILDFYQRELPSIKDSEIKQCVKTLRTSGLFVECGKDLYCFEYYALQEYFVALYLVGRPLEELKQFALQHYHLDAWREPLRLVLTYKSKQGNRDERRETEEIIRAIVDVVAKEAHYNDLLHQNLLFTATSIADCGAWSIDRTIQQQVANRIFDLFDDTFGTRYYALQKQELKVIALYWLNAQPHVTSKEESTPPLLEYWRTALCDITKPLRQAGAAHLIAELAPALSTRTFSVSILRTFIPPLLQLADLLGLDLPYPGAVRQNLPQPPAQAASLRVEEYAYIALRRFETYGPAKWLHDKWLEWNEKQPGLAERLTEHSHELLYLITPAAFPDKADNPYWAVQRKIGNTWQKLYRQQSYNLQAQLLNASDVARYPHAYLLYQLLESELASPSSATVPWYTIWDKLLQEEMQRGRSATYSACLSLRLLLSRVIERQPQKLAYELEASLQAHDRRQTQALITIANLYWQNAQLADELLKIFEIRKMLNYLNATDIIDIQDLQTPNNMRYTEYAFSLRNALNHEKIVDKLCSILEKTEDIADSSLLLAFYCVITFNQSISLTLIKHVQFIFQGVTQRIGQKISTEDRLLIEATQRQINETMKRFDSSR